jgi:hypothetical protein
MIGSRDHSPCWMLRLKCGDWQKLAPYTPDPSMMSRRTQMVIQRYDYNRTKHTGNSKLLRSGSRHKWSYKEWTLASSFNLSRNIWPCDLPVSAKLKVVRRIWKKVFISIMEKRILMHDKDSAELALGPA